MQENLKLLLKYIVDSFWDQLVKFEYLVSIHSLKVKYEQVFSNLYLPVLTQAHSSDSRLCACLQCLDNDGAKGTAIMIKYTLALSSLQQHHWIMRVVVAALSDYVK